MPPKRKPASRKPASRKPASRKPAKRRAPARKAAPKLDAALKEAVRAAYKAAHATQLPAGAGGYGGWVWVATPDKAVAPHIRGIGRRKERGMYRGFFPAMKGATHFLQTERACDAFSGKMRARGFKVYCTSNID
jgi:hypothetical protein